MPVESRTEVDVRVAALADETARAASPFGIASRERRRRGLELRLDDRRACSRCLGERDFALDATSTFPSRRRSTALP